MLERDMNGERLHRVTMLVGGKGIGKHTYVNRVSALAHAPLYDMTYENNLGEFIRNCYTVDKEVYYIIDLDELGYGRVAESKENALLKFIEEPPANATIFLLTTNYFNVLQPILNRCHIKVFPSLTSEEVAEKIGSDGVKENVYDTYGKITEYNEEEYNNMRKLADTIIDKIHMANLSNTLSIANKIKFKEDEKGFDCGLFVNILSTSMFIRSESLHSDIFRMFATVSKYKSKVNGFALNKRFVFEKMLIELWEVARECRNI